jgi:hypothetical protein
VKALPVVLAGLFLMGSSAAGQEGTPEGLESVRLTQLVREALKAPDAPEAWAGLAQGLSMVNAGRPAGAPSLDSAIRVADSMAFAPLQAREGLSKGPEEGTLPRWMGILRSSDPRVSAIMDGAERLWNLSVPGGLIAGDLFLVVSLLGLLLGGRIVLGKPSRKIWHRWYFRERWGRSTVGRGVKGMGEVVQQVARVAGNGSSRPGPGARHQEDPHALALALRDGGMPAFEIARRTGISQDELAVALALRVRKGGLGGSGLSTSSWSQ